MEEGNRSILTSEEEEEQNNTRMTRWIPEDYDGIHQKKWHLIKSRKHFLSSFLSFFLFFITWHNLVTCNLT